MEKAPFLTWWRRYPRYTFKYQVMLGENMLARLLELTPAEVVGDDHGDPLAVAVRLSDARAPRDLLMSWILLAAVQGDPDAALELGRALTRRMEKLPLTDSPAEPQDESGDDPDETMEPGRWMVAGLPESRPAPTFARELARDWLHDVATEYPSILRKSGRDTRSKRLHTLESVNVTDAKARRKHHDPWVPTLQPVAEIGDSESRQGASYAAQYKALLEPMPLAGGDVDPDALIGALDLEFPWLQEVVALIADDLTLLGRAGQPWFHIPPLLMVGSPGVGKTRFARRLGALSGTGMTDISAAGSSDSRALSGTARGWSSAQPGLAILAMLRSGTANPIVVVDEIDKAGGSQHGGHLHATLLGLLEPETARAWPDECLLAPVNVSKVSWILTANDASRLPSPLLSRVRVVACGTPQPEHAAVLVAGLLRDLAADYGVPVESLGSLPPEVHAALCDAAARGTDARALKRALRRSLAQGPAVENLVH